MFQMIRQSTRRSIAIHVKIDLISLRRIKFSATFYTIFFLIIIAWKKWKYFVKLGHQLFHWAIVYLRILNVFRLSYTKIKRKYFTYPNYRICSIVTKYDLVFSNYLSIIWDAKHIKIWPWLFNENLTIEACMNEETI